MNDWTMLLVAALVVAALVYVLWSRRRRDTMSCKHHHRTENTRDREFYSPFVGVERRYKQPHVPRPVDQQASPSTSPLAGALSRALDAVVPAHNGGGEAVPYDDAEVRQMLQGVVDRVNAASPNLGLVLVSFDNVRKTVDSYKTLRYQADMNVYSKPDAFGARVGVEVDVDTKGAVYIRALRAHQAKLASDGLDTAFNGGGTAFVESYAKFDPVAKYPF